MSELSEEEIIKRLKNIIEINKSFLDCTIRENSNIYKDIQGLLDLYQKEKQKNEEFLNKLENSLDFARTSQDIISTTQANLLERIIKEFRELLEERK